MELEILDAKSSKSYGKVNVSAASISISELRVVIHKTLNKTPHADRISL